MSLHGKSQIFTVDQRLAYGGKGSGGVSGTLVALNYGFTGVPIKARPAGKKGGIDSKYQMAVYTPEGKRIGTAYSKASADALIERYQKKLKEKKRNCMCCGVEFLSKGIENRMCNRCRHPPATMD
jgi:hypothetical protein